jgi:uncharacterized protein (TIGR00255 family)
MEARSVNHRFLDVRVRMPRELVEYGLFVEQHCRQKLSRGRVEVTVHAEALTAASLTLDRERALTCLHAFEQLARDVGHEAPVPLSLLASVPELFVHARTRDPEADRAALTHALDRALGSLDAMRDREGADLARDLTERLGLVRANLDRVTALVPAMVARHRGRFRERVATLLEGLGERLHEVRIEQELAILTEHLDVSEELTRLQSHCGSFGEFLREANPVGRRMDFLLQEMAREVNTLGSKCSDAEVALRVVELKVEIERMREQAQNVE